MTVNSVCSSQCNAIKESGERRTNEIESDFSTILVNTCSNIGFAGIADTVSSCVTELSEQAWVYLEKLKKRFGDTDFIISDFANEEQARELLKSGTGNYNCVLTPGLLEEMAANDDVRAEYEALIEKANDEIDKMREALKNCAVHDVNSFGFIFIDGCVKYFASIVKDDITYNISANTPDDIIEQLSIPDLYLEEYNFHREYYDKMAVC